MIYCLWDLDPEGLRALKPGNHREGATVKAPWRGCHGEGTIGRAPREDCCLIYKRERQDGMKPRNDKG